MTQITDAMLKEWEGLCERATPEPWEADNPPEPYPNWYLVYAKKAEPPLIIRVLRGESTAGLSSWAAPRDDQTEPRAQRAKANADFIAAARTALPLLLAEVRRLRGEGA